MQHDPGSTPINDIALHQIKRQVVDPNITFIGGRTSTHIPVQDGERSFQPEIVMWIARHSVVPDQPQPRAIALTEPEDAANALLEALVEAILPPPDSALAPMMPGRIEVADEATARAVRQALEGVDVEVGIADDMTIIDTLSATLSGDVRRHFVPIPPWEVPVQNVRELATAAANLYRREPWSVLDTIPPVAIEIKRYGIDTLYFALAYGTDEAEGIIAYRSLEGYHMAGKISFLMNELEDADGEIINLDQSAEDVALLEEAVRHPEMALGEAITLFYEPTDEVNEETMHEIREMKLPLASRQAVPIFTRMSHDEQPRRPNVDETRALRLAIEGFNAFFTKNRDRLENEAWHFAPLTATIMVRDGEAKVPVTVSVTSPSATFDPTLRDAVLLLRVYLNDDLSIWREIEALAQQPLGELDETIQQSFGWPDRDGSFLPKDVNDGDDTYESVLLEDTVSSPKAPIGLMLKEARDFCHYMFDVENNGISHRVRLVSISKRERGVDYPRMVRSHGDVPSLFFDDDEVFDDAIDDDNDDDGED